MTEQKYNGWTNYATWRINLEIFDGWDWWEWGKENPLADEVCPDFLKDYAETIIFELPIEKIPNLVESYARAFISDVNWYEIAEHFNNELKEQMDEATNERN